MPTPNQRAEMTNKHYKSALHGIGDSGIESIAELATTKVLPWYPEKGSKEEASEAGLKAMGFLSDAQKKNGVEFFKHYSKKIGVPVKKLWEDAVVNGESLSPNTFPIFLQAMTTVPHFWPSKIGAAAASYPNGGVCDKSGKGVLHEDYLNVWNLYSQDDHTVNIRNALKDIKNRAPAVHAYIVSMVFAKYNKKKASEYANMEQQRTEIIDTGVKAVKEGGKVAVDVVKSAGNVVKGTVDFAAFITKYTPWIIGGVAVLGVIYIIRKTFKE